MSAPCRYCDSDMGLGVRRLCLEHAHAALERLVAAAEEVLEDAAGAVDINQHGGPNLAMRVTTTLEAALPEADPCDYCHRPAHPGAFCQAEVSAMRRGRHSNNPDGHDVEGDR